MKRIGWDIRRGGRRWSDEEFDQRLYQAPERIEFVDGIFASDRERVTVLGMLLENLGAVSMELRRCPARYESPTLRSARLATTKK